MPKAPTEEQESVSEYLDRQKRREAKRKARMAARHAEKLRKQQNFESQQYEDESKNQQGRRQAQGQVQPDGESAPGQVKTGYDERRPLSDGTALPDPEVYDRLSALEQEVKTLKELYADILDRIPKRKAGRRRGRPPKAKTASGEKPATGESGESGEATEIPSSKDEVTKGGGTEKPKLEDPFPPPPIPVGDPKIDILNGKRSERASAASSKVQLNAVTNKV